MPTMGAHLALLPKGFKGKDYQSTDGTIFVCVEGEGSTKVGGKMFEWGPKDVFVVPSWMKYSHNAKKESVLFSISDRPAQEALGIWREKKFWRPSQRQFRTRPKARCKMPGPCADGVNVCRISEVRRGWHGSSGVRARNDVVDLAQAGAAVGGLAAAAAGGRTPAARCRRRCR